MPDLFVSSTRKCATKGFAMSRNIYAVGDAVTLKDGVLRTVDKDRVWKIVGILPSDHGEAQYRVRLGGEAHERRIVASDIEAASGHEDDPSPVSRSGEPWLKPSSIRIHK